MFENRVDTWGDGLIKYPHCDIGDVVRSLGDKYDDENVDVSSEIAELKELRSVQQKYLDETLQSEKEGLEKAIDLMQKYAD